MFFHYATRKISTICKILTFSEDLSFFNPKSHQFRLLESEILKIFSIRERDKSRHKFGGTKVCKAEEVRKCFVNPKIEIEVFS